jgi:hypothetical protein
MRILGENYIYLTGNQGVFLAVYASNSFARNHTGKLKAALRMLVYNSIKFAKKITYLVEDNVVQGNALVCGALVKMISNVHEISFRVTLYCHYNPQQSF